MSVAVTLGVQTAPRVLVDPRLTAPDAPLLTVVIPTRNEVRNVARVAERATTAVSSLGFSARLLFVDDSDDATPAALRHQQSMGRAVDVIHRPRPRRRGGRSSAVAAGIAAAKSPFVAVMDADLEHPPELLVALLRPLLDGTADVTVGVPDEDGRRPPRRWSRRAARMLVPRSRAVSEPLEGFFAFRRSVLGTGRTSRTTPTLLDLLARGDWDHVVEVRYPATGRVGRRDRLPVRARLATFRHVASLAGARRRTRRPRTVGLAPAAGGDAPTSGSVAPLASVSVLDTGRAPARPPIVGRAFDATATRLALAAVLVIAAFWYPLRALMETWDPADPLTVVAAVPLLAALLLLALAAPAPGEAAIHDREVDLLIGIPAVALAVAAVWLLPRSIGSAFWVNRVDLLALPLFVAGIVTVLFGTRALWRERWALLFLFLAWPPAMRALVDRVEPTLGTLTLDGVARIADRFDVTRVGDTARFVGAGAVVDTGAGGSAAVIGVLAGVLAIALALTMVGSVRRRLLWVAAAITAALMLNVVRLELASAAAVNDEGAISRAVITPLGMVLTAVLGVLAILLLRDRFGLALRARSGEPVRAPRRSGIGTVAIVALAVAAAIATAGFTRYAPLADALGSPQVAPVAEPPLRIPGFTIEDRGRLQALLGPLVTREYLARRAATISAPVVIDAIAGADSGAGAVGDLRARYPLHGYRSPTRTAVALGRGVDATLVTFAARSGLRWEALTWVWPVRGSQRYERVVVHGGAPETVVGAGGSGTHRSPGARAATAAQLRTTAERLVASATAGGRR